MSFDRFRWGLEAKVRIRRSVAAPPPDPITPNALVAFNLGRARQELAWTQREAAVRLTEAGMPISEDGLRLAENSWKHDRVRRFSADELVSMSLAFEQPLSYFFTAPNGSRPRGRVALTTGSGKTEAILLSQMHRSLFGSPARPQRPKPGDVRRYEMLLQDLTQVAQDLEASAATMEDVKDRVRALIGSRYDGEPFR